MQTDVNAIARRILEACEARGWDMHWTCRGAYLHLEASELIESIRGKGDSTPEEEAADVLLVLMSITESAGIAFSRVCELAMDRATELLTEPRYPGEYRRVDRTEGE